MLSDVSSCSLMYHQTFMCFLFYFDRLELLACIKHWDAERQRDFQVERMKARVEPAFVQRQKQIGFYILPNNRVGDEFLESISLIKFFDSKLEAAEKYSRIVA